VTERSRAVFLSYASEDANAAARICEALRAGGIEVLLRRERWAPAPVADLPEGSAEEARTSAMFG